MLVNGDYVAFYDEDTRRGEALPVAVARAQEITLKVAFAILCKPPKQGPDYGRRQNYSTRLRDEFGAFISAS